MTENRSKSDQYQLRLPDGLRDALKRAADKSGRSMNSEIISRIVEYENLRLMASRASSLEESLQAANQKIERLSDEIEGNAAYIDNLVDQDSSKTESLYSQEYYTNLLNDDMIDLKRMISEQRDIISRLSHFRRPRPSMGGYSRKSKAAKVRSK